MRKRSRGDPLSQFLDLEASVDDADESEQQGEGDDRDGKSA